MAGSGARNFLPAGRSAVTRRRGVVYVLAMLYLVLFAVLAIGFYAAATMSVQMAGNEADTARALLATESGTHFVRYQLGRLNIPAATPQDQLLTEVYNDLSEQMDGTANMGASRVELTGDRINVPAGETNHIRIDADGSRFRAVIEQAGQQLRVTVVGRCGDSEITRAIRLDYAVAQNESAIFDYGVASRSPVTLDSNARILGATDPARGSVLSTSARTPTISLDSNASVSGVVAFTSRSAALDYDSNASVGGYRTRDAGFEEQIKYLDQEPEFPTVDTSAFERFATNVLSEPEAKYDNRYLKNVRVKAGTNPRFDGNSVIEGVIYIETPNLVHFDSNTQIRGVIVVQNNPTGDVTTNRIEFDSNVTIDGVESLDPAEFGDLTKLTGALILAPKFAVDFDSNFGSAGGSIIAGEMHFDSNARGVIRGSIINLEDTALDFDSNCEIVIEGRGTSTTPAGLTFSGHYVPLAETYLEVQP